MIPPYSLSPTIGLAAQQDLSYALALNGSSGLDAEDMRDHGADRIRVKRSRSWCKWCVQKGLWTRETRNCPSEHNALMATDAEQVEEVVDWFARLGFDIATEWRDLTESLPRRYRGRGKGYWVDLVSLRTGEVFWPNYASGPTEPLAIIGAEQRYLVEEVGDRPAAPGKTYLDKAEERLRRGREEPVLPPS